MNDSDDMNDFDDDDDFLDDDSEVTEDFLESTKRAGRNCMRKIERARDRLALRRALGDFDFVLD